MTKKLFLLSLFLSVVLSACGTTNLPTDPSTSTDLLTQATFGAYSVDVVKTDEWYRGFQGALVLKNKRGAAVKSFEITFKLKGNNPISKSWGGNFSAPKNGVITVTSPNYLKLNGVRRGSSFESGFVAGGTFAGGTVVGLKVNGKKVGGGTTDPPVPPTGIPRPFDLFTVIDNYVLRPEFSKVSRWYQEYPGKQVFRLFTGDEYNGARKHARTEAGGGLKFKRSGAWHEFEARMKLSNTLDYTYTVAQLFAGCCGPQARIEVKPNGRVHVGSRSNGNVRISPDANYADGRRTFKIKIRTNGVTFKVYFNNSLKFTGTTEESQKDNNDALYHFRWGVYSNYKMRENLTNTVTEISRY